MKQHRVSLRIGLLWSVLWLVAVMHEGTVIATDAAALQPQTQITQAERQDVAMASLGRGIG